VLTEGYSTTVGTNWTSDSCPSLFRSLRASQQFQSCLPLSLLLSSSSAFLQVERNITQLSRLLDASCAAPANCTTVMGLIAEQLQSADGCASDLAAGNALAAKALVGLRAYDVMREVGCLVNPATGAYCFVQALAPAAPPGNAYLYQLASPGVATIPSNVTVACDNCLAGTMATFACVRRSLFACCWR
jgi:hypothetical protein